MEEVKIWNYVIKWGIAQNPGLSSDPEEWSNENILTLKTTLKNCLPLIRYFQISGDDLYEYIQPYQQILEKNLWKFSQKTYAPNKSITSAILPPRMILKTVLPHRSTEQFSKVINEAHAAEIASWINRNANTYSILNIPYEVKLLLRESRDGFTHESFWNLCD
ncbi:hypothetical protein C2G38_2037922 [Gigaspora rosea]|uniref:BACK domain-containing protein n=1 Tax=Gigaspora rosea TaxID=44941 RepID=A0A397VB50_9GLOM|nr:hypothetical protein C2G38_2037922 [Gigaspora rosea]